MPVEQDLLPAFTELETSTRCNRVCSWCPNSVYPRGREQRYIDGGLFAKILDDLSDLSYHGELALHNFNEPLLDEHLFEHIAEVRKKLGDACLTLFTNGDYLDQMMMSRIESSGVQTLIISLHDAIGKADKDIVIGCMQRKLQLEGDCADVSDQTGMKLATFYKGMKIVYYVPDTTMLTSRGGIVERYNQSGQGSRFCYLPFSSAAIDVDGNLKLCCEVYPEDEVHMEHGMVGNLSEHTFEELWFSDHLNDVRRKILQCTNDNAICSNCPGYLHGIDTEKIGAWRKFI